MPIVKVKREDVLSEDEFQRMLSKLSGQDIITGTYETTLEGKPVTQKFNIECRKAECLLCLLWVFGKRIQEILLLKRKDLSVENGFLYVEFIVLKKKETKGQPVRIKHTKRITLKHPYVHYITDYINSVEDQNSFLFPGQTGPRDITSKVNSYEYWRDEQGNLKRSVKDVRVYKYRRTQYGFMSAQLAWKIIKFLDSNVYPHLFRHTLATRMAKHGFTEDELMDWFDWDTPKTAHDYVNRERELTPKAATRTW